jgi:hypothetical protein
VALILDNIDPARRMENKAVGVDTRGEEPWIPTRFHQLRQRRLESLNMAKAKEMDAREEE